MEPIYNYRESVEEDIKQYLEEVGLTEEEITEVNFHDVLDDITYTSSVTGNDNGSYTCNSLQAERNLYGNWDLMQEAHEELGLEIESAESADVIIRCYLVNEILNEMVDF